MAKNKLYGEEIEYDIDWELFRKRLQSLLDSRGYNKADLARATKIAMSTVARYFYERTPDLLAACILADHFGVTLDWLLGRSDKKYLETSKEAQELYDKYTPTNGADRTIIDTILAKYE